ncbi:CPBP family intramembrane glutamic endopeptidase [Microbacterium sp. G2-8]|uniref:CPBP family intramembrane glutamic endopeptidase n=1 Tax=Microbacterium sp. G2-8 TaxID=2842454 RepID=UPI001C89BA79|nr:CPBP family intramembrane glutamic endopeptidase [Microbacterium sp. G2-8]
MPATYEAPDRPLLPVAVAPALVVCLAAFCLFGLQIRPLGYALLVVGVGGSWLLARRGLVAAGRRGEGPHLTRDLGLIALGLVCASSIPLAAKLDDLSMVAFTLALGGAVAVPYVVSRFWFRDHAIRFPWRGGGRWTRWQWAWLAGVVGLGWLILPFYFVTSGVYRNWPVVDDGNLIARLFVGVGAVGIWDELFFICTVFALLRRHVADITANGLQAIVFVSFLWELGYREWGPALTIPFALLQAVIFLKTRSLAYVVTVHLLFDAVVFLVLVHAHNPGVLDAIFLV